MSVVKENLEYKRSRKHVEAFRFRCRDPKKTDTAFPPDERHYLSLLAMAGFAVGVFRLDEDRRTVFFWPMCWPQYPERGCSESELSGGVGGTVFDEDKPLAAEGVRRALAGENVKFQHRVVGKDGGIVWVETHLFPVTNTVDRVTAVDGISIDITRCREIDETLRKRHQDVLGMTNEELVRVNEELQVVLDSMQSGVLTIDAETHTILSANRMAVEMTGLPKEEVIGAQCHDIICPAEKGVCPITDLGRSIDHAECVLVRDNDEQVPIIKTVVPVVLGGRKCFIESFVDIGAQKRAEEQWRNAKMRLAGVLDAIPDVIGVQDSDHRIIRLNQAGCRLFKLTPEEAKGKKCYELIGRTDRCRPCATEKAWRTKRLERVEKYVPELGRYLDCRSNPVLDRNGRIIMVVKQFYDVTERKRMEEQLRHLSLHDSLTGLYNRAYFEQEMRRYSGVGHTPVGVIICDVDGLKLVNDTMGHEAGNALLQATAGVLMESFRESDMVGRVGGGEFAVLLPRSDRRSVENAGQRIRKAVRNYNAGNSGLPLSISIGVAVSNGHAADTAELFREAANSMYREKLHHSQSARSAIVQTLMKALEARDFITEGHAERLQNLVVAVAADLGLPEHKMSDLRLLARFHDIGKVGIPDRILFKSSPLTPEERAEMERHCEIGHRIALSAPDLIPIADWILKHHEWWNGGGYPLGLQGEEIPLECRILAIADAYDAMTHDRPYRKAMTHEEAMAELKRRAGTQFDPDLARMFLRMI